MRVGSGDSQPWPLSMSHLAGRFRVTRFPHNGCSGSMRLYPNGYRDISSTVCGGRWLTIRLLMTLPWNPHQKRSNMHSIHTWELYIVLRKHSFSNLTNIDNLHYHHPSIPHARIAPPHPLVPITMVPYFPPTPWNENAACPISGCLSGHLAVFPEVRWFPGRSCKVVYRCGRSVGCSSQLSRFPGFLAWMLTSHANTPWVISTSLLPLIHF